MIEMIDCVSSQFLPRAERAELAELRAACGGPPAPAPDGGRGGQGGRGGDACSDGSMPVCTDGSRAGVRGCADRNRPACAGGPAPAPPAPPPAPQLELALAVDISSIAAGTPARLRFEQTFKVDVARVAGVQARRIVIDGVSAGSVVVSFHVEQPFGLAAATAAQASSTDATAALQTALATGTVAIAGEVFLIFEIF